MKTILKRGMILMLVVLCWACEQQAAAPVFIDEPIVEAYLKEGHPLSLKVSRQIAYDNTASYSADDVGNLLIYISVDDSIFVLKPQGSGLYQDSGMMIQEGREYGIAFEYNHKKVEGSTVVPTKPENLKQSASSLDIPVFSAGSGSMPTFPDPIDITWSNHDHSYYLLVVENIESSPKLINDTTDTGRPSISFRNDPTTESSAEIRFMQFKYYGWHRLILYHLNPEYAALYKSNGSSSQNLSAGASNLSNAKGIFTATSSDTLKLYVY